MFDISTFIVSFIGTLLGVIYLHLVERWQESEEGKLSDKSARSDFIQKVRFSIRESDGLNSVLKDYETTNREIERRENIGLVIGSILITGSLIILGNMATSNGSVTRFPYAVASISLFAIWLFVLHGSTVKLDNLSYMRAKAIEEALSESPRYDFGIHRYMSRETRAREKGKENDPVWWLDVRRSFWGFIFILLCVGWALVSVLG
jgi:hypothetical protein